MALTEPSAISSSTRLRPTLNVLGRSVKRGRVVVELSCPTEACKATAAGRVLVPGAARAFSLRPATAQIQKGNRATLVLRLSKKAWRMARRALRANRTVRIRVDLTVTDSAGNATTARRTINVRG